MRVDRCCRDVRVTRCLARQFQVLRLPQDAADRCVAYIVRAKLVEADLLCGQLYLPHYALSERAALSLPHPLLLGLRISPMRPVDDVGEDVLRVGYHAARA